MNAKSDPGEEERKGVDPVSSEQNPGLFLSSFKEIMIPSLPKSSKYLVRKCLDPPKALPQEVFGGPFTPILTRYLED